MPWLVLAGLLVFCFGAAARLDLWYQNWEGNRTGSADPVSVLLGDSRRMFANHFFVKADAYFHSGFYPTVFDNREAFRTPHMAEDSGTVAGANQGDEKGFLGRPRDWIDRFSRQFFPSRHTHLDEGGAAGDLGDSSAVREIMPWLKLSTELNPNDIRNYTVAAYWLRERMGRTAEAEAFLRDGLRANPDSYEILYELGRVYAENRNDPVRAINLWQAALRQWQRQEAANSDPDKFLVIEITSHLAMLESKQGDHQQAIQHMEICKHYSPSPEAIEQIINDLKVIAARAPASGAALPTTPAKPPTPAHADP